MYAKLFVTAGPLMVLPLVALFMFIGIFVMVVLRTMTRPAQEIASLAALPLDQEKDDE